MHSSVYCLPADLLGEGADRVVGTVRDRTGVSGVTVAACYHASRDILPHNPVYRVASLAPGARGARRRSGSHARSCASYAKRPA